MSKTKDKVIQALNDPGPELNIVREQHGFHWRIFHGADLVCKGTNPHPNEDAAIKEAKKYFCKAWELV